MLAWQTITIHLTIPGQFTNYKIPNMVSIRYIYFMIYFGKLSANRLFLWRNHIKLYLKPILIWNVKISSGIFWTICLVKRLIYMKLCIREKKPIGTFQKTWVEVWKQLYAVVQCKIVHCVNFPGASVYQSTSVSLRACDPDLGFIFANRANYFWFGLWWVTKLNITLTFSDNIRTLV